MQAKFFVPCTNGDDDDDDDIIIIKLWVNNINY